MVFGLTQEGDKVYEFQRIKNTETLIAGYSGRAIENYALITHQVTPKQ